MAWWALETLGEPTENSRCKGLACWVFDRRAFQSLTSYPHIHKIERDNSSTQPLPGHSRSEQSVQLTSSGFEWVVHSLRPSTDIHSLVLHNFYGVRQKWGELLHGVGTRKHTQQEAEKPCCWRGFLWPSDQHSDIFQSIFTEEAYSQSSAWSCTNEDWRISRSRRRKYFHQAITPFGCLG